MWHFIKYTASAMHARKVNMDVFGFYRCEKIIIIITQHLAHHMLVIEDELQARVT